MSERARAWYLGFPVAKGGQGSGHRGHRGVSGQHGGSAPAGGGVGSIPWKKTKSGLAGSVYVDDPLGGLLAKYSIKKGQHGWDASVRVADASEGTEYREFRRSAHFIFEGEGKALAKAKGALERHVGRMKSGEYGESPDLEP